MEWALIRTQGSRQTLPALLDLLTGDKESQRGVYRQEEANQADSLLEKILLVLCRHCAEGWEWRSGFILLVRDEGGLAGVW